MQVRNIKPGFRESLDIIQKSRPWSRGHVFGEYSRFARSRVTTSKSDVHIYSHICSFSQIQYFSKVKKEARVSMSMSDVHILVTLAHSLTIDIYHKREEARVTMSKSLSDVQISHL